MKHLWARLLLMSALTFHPWFSFSLSQVEKLTVLKIENDLKQHRGSDFSGLIREWELAHGKELVPALAQIAFDQTKIDTDRYIAIMGLGKVAGSSSLSILESFLNDRSWMIRTAVLRAMGSIKKEGQSEIAPQALEKVREKLKDPSLLVRLEALRTFDLLEPTTGVTELMQVLRDSNNYHRGKSQWVPEAAVDLLKKRKITAAEKIAIEASLKLIPDSKIRARLTREVLTASNKG